MSSQVNGQAQLRAPSVPYTGYSSFLDTQRQCSVSLLQNRGQTAVSECR